MIVFLCQECGGDLRPLRQYNQVEHEWVCEHCSRVWVYGPAGWELVTVQAAEDGGRHG